jgi:D-serine deaminase-like pyridoxal phosphate-dependent protein
MPTTVDSAAVAALAQQPLDWRFKGVPAAWWGRTPEQICATGPDLFAAGAVGPVCVLRADALTHNLVTMARWCRRHGVELAPHGKTHMSPQLAQRQLAVGAYAITVATIAQARLFRAFGVRDIVLANQLVDAAGLAWLAAELDAHPDLRVVCWVDSVAGVELMTAALGPAGRPVEVCVEVGMAGGRTGCRDSATVDAVAAAAAASPRLRLVGVAGYEAATGQEVTADGVDGVTGYLRELRAAVLRLAPLFETDEILVTAGGSTYFDVVADVLTDWPVPVRTVLRSGCYLTHDDGLYARTSPLGRTDPAQLQAALSVWAQVISRPEPELALVTMGRRDVSFDAGLPVPYDLPASRVSALNDQHAFLRLGGTDRAAVGDWLRFGISHPCTTFDKWALIPLVDNDNRVVDLIRTYF